MKPNNLEISDNTIINRIKACIFGHAIGDALGLATEFMSRQEVQKNYPNGVNSYNDIVQDHHRRKWKKGAWTDDTEQMLCIFDSLIKHRDLNLKDIASNFVFWKENNGMGIGRHTLNLLNISEYTDKPFEASELLWNMSRKQAAPNGGIMRTSILGCWNYKNIDAVCSNAENVCKLTHFDPRCTGSCVIICYIISSVLQKLPFTKENLIEIAKKYDSRIIEYIELAFQPEISLLKLDESSSIGYTLKTMCAALWAYNYGTDYFSGLKTIIEQGGDADTNGAVAGALLGVKFGYDAIPTHLTNYLIGHEELEKRIEILF